MWLEALGWSGSALLVYSLLQKSVLRLRLLNLLACVMLVAFNAVLGVWPMVVMNGVLVLINGWFLQHLVRHRHDESEFDVLEVRPDNEYLRHVLRVHGPDIAKFNRAFEATAVDDRQHRAFLVLRGDETIGVLVLRQQGDTAYLVLDYVTRRYRDFSPGEFLWRRSAFLRGLGIQRVVTASGMVDPYYGRLGFSWTDDRFVLEVDA